MSNPTEAPTFQTTPPIIDLAFKAALTASSDLEAARTNLARVKKTEAIYPEEAINATVTLWKHVQQLSNEDRLDDLLEISTRLDVLLNFLLVSSEIDQREILQFLQKLSVWAKSNTNRINNANFQSMLSNALQERMAQEAK